MSDSKPGIDRGFLVLADISGYTAFLSKAELEHAQEILTDLLETIVDGFKTLLTIHKIEGDAVFAYTRDAHLLRGETLLELIESTYVAFRQRTKNVRRHTTCDCRACNNISTLDLKFIVHHGDFAHAEHRRAARAGRHRREPGAPAAQEPRQRADRLVGVCPLQQAGPGAAPGCTCRAWSTASRSTSTWGRADLRPGPARTLRDLMRASGTSRWRRRTPSCRSPQVIRATPAGAVGLDE